MTGPVRDTAAMIAGMAPKAMPGRFVFCITADPALTARATPLALGSFREAEGLSLILPEAEARALGFDAALPMACITLTVASALDGVGLTAAVAAALAEAGIPCNIVAAFHHDHVFVPEDDLARALDVLKSRASAG